MGQVNFTVQSILPYILKTLREFVVNWIFGTGRPQLCGIGLKVCPLPGNSIFKKTTRCLLQHFRLGSLRFSQLIIIVRAYRYITNASSRIVVISSFYCNADKIAFCSNEQKRNLLFIFYKSLPNLKVGLSLAVGYLIAVLKSILWKKKRQWTVWHQYM